MAAGRGIVAFGTTKRAPDDVYTPLIPKIASEATSNDDILQNYATVLGQASDGTTSTVIAPIPSPNKSCNIVLQGISTCISAFASLKAAMATIAWLGDIGHASEEISAPVGGVLGAFAVPFYVENVMAGLMAAKARVDASFANEIRRYSFDLDPSANRKKANAVLALAGRLTVADYVAEYNLKKEKDKPYLAYSPIDEKELEAQSVLESIDGSLNSGKASSISTLEAIEPKEVDLEKVGKDVNKVNVNLAWYVTAWLGGLGGAAGQSGMILSAPPALIADNALVVDGFSLTVGVANLFTMYPNALRSREAFAKLVTFAYEGKWGNFSRECATLLFSSIASSSNILGAKDAALKLMSIATTATDITNPVSWVFGIIATIPVIGLNMNASDDFRTKITKHGKFDKAKAAEFFKDNFWGMLLCAVSNALPSSWYTYALIAGTPLAPPGAIAVTAITGIFLIITKGPAFQRFLQDCWKNENLRSCLTCCGVKVLKDCITFVCCCKSDSRTRSPTSATGASIVPTPMATGPRDISEIAEGERVTLLGDIMQTAIANGNGAEFAEALGAASAAVAARVDVGAEHAVSGAGKDSDIAIPGGGSKKRRGSSFDIDSSGTITGPSGMGWAAGDLDTGNRHLSSAQEPPPGGALTWLRSLVADAPIPDEYQAQGAGKT